MKLGIKITIILVAIFGILFAFTNESDAIDIKVETIEGARIRTNDQFALQFTGKVSEKIEGAKYGFYYQKGELSLQDILSINNVMIAYADRLNSDNTFVYAFNNLNENDIETKYTVVAFVEIEGEKIVANNVTTRSILQVANNLGKGSATYVDKIINLVGTYYETKVILNPNGGSFISDSSTESKELNLKDPCAFPEITKEGYKLSGWKNFSEGKTFASYPGTKKENQTITYVAMWESLPTATKIISELLPSDLQSEFEVPKTYEGKELIWSVETNDFITYSNYKFTYSPLAKDHYSHSIKVTLEYNGTKANKIYKITPIELKDLSKKSPFAIYFAIGSIGNYITYIGHSETKLFSDKVASELDIVYYAFAGLDANGNISLYRSDKYQTQINKQLAELRQNGTRIVLSISGVSDAQCKAFNTICDSETLRKTFINNLLNAIEKEHFDGIDIDWESASSTNTVSATKMNVLMQELREEMDRRTGTGPKYLLTAAVPATSWGTAPDRFDLKTLNNYVDYINMMSYDLNHDTNSSHVSPLYTSSNDNGYKFSADKGAKLFISLGLSAKKIIVGTAAYGKTYLLTGTGYNKNYPGLGIAGTLGKINGITGSYASGTIYYNGVLELMKNSNYKKYTEYNATNQYVGTYLYNETDKIFVAYEGEETIKLKAEYAKQNGYGIMIWSYGEDGSGNLCQVIAENIR